VDSILGLAVIQFKRSQTEDALKLWLQVIEKNPGNRVAKRGLSLLRKGFEAAELQEFIESGKMKGLFPPLPSRLRISVVLIGVLTLLILGCLAYLGTRVIGPFGAPRPGVGDIEIPGELAVVVGSNVYDPSYVLTERQVRQMFELAKRDLLLFRDNIAVVEINRILLSNATLQVKERARILKEFVATPTFTTFRDGFSYAEVEKAPALYEGGFVSWKGEIANLAADNQAASFDFLVGYDQRRELLGVVKVTVPFAVQLENGIPLEVLARVAVENGKPVLGAVSLHRLVRSP
jgi:hypothetical protein